MARSWASVVRGSTSTSGSEMPEWIVALVEDNTERQRISKVKQVWAEMDVKHGLSPRGSAPAVSVLRAEAPEWKPPPSCYYCGASADVCPKCVKTCSYYPAWGLQPVLRKGLCAQHHSYGVPHAFFNKNMQEFMPQTCSSCREKHPWRQEDSLEVTGFSYEKSCFCHPLSPINVVYVNKHRYIRLGEAKSTPEVVVARAQAAYDVEMAFSGKAERAEIVRKTILENNLWGVYLRGI